MEIFLYRADSNHIEEGFTYEQLPDLLKDETNVIWVDLHEPSVDHDDKALSEIFHFHPLTIEDSRSDRHHPKVEEYPGYLFFIIHGVRPDEDTDRFNTVELDGYLGRNYVVTYHHEGFPSIEHVKQRLRANPLACQRGAAFLLHQIIDIVVDDYAPILEDFDERISELEDRIFALRQPDSSLLAELQTLKRSILRLRRVSSKQLNVVYRMSHGDFALIGGAVLPFYRDVYDHLVRVSDLAENYRDMLSSAFDAYHSVVSTRLNEVMKVLTIISAIGVPCTIIVGIYGMNFDYLPELHWKYGYYFVWGMMLFVVALMLFFFWRRGWIGSSGRRDDASTRAE